MKETRSQGRKVCSLLMTWHSKDTLENTGRGWNRKVRRVLEKKELCKVRRRENSGRDSQSKMCLEGAKVTA